MPLTMQFKLGDICFFIGSLKSNSPDISFSILDFTSFSQSPTRFQIYNKLVQALIKNNRDKQFYFNRLGECTATDRPQSS